MAPDRLREHRFAERYADIILRLREARPDIEILLVTNNDSHYRRRHNPNAERVRQTMVSLSDELGVACWDLYGALGGPTASNGFARRASPPPTTCTSTGPAMNSSESCSTPPS